MRVGTKALKNRLSEYLRAVRRGQRIYVTDRGRVIAEIRSVSLTKGGAQKRRLQELAARGDLVLGEGAVKDFEPVAPLRRGTRLSLAVLEDRG